MGSTKDTDDRVRLWNQLRDKYYVSTEATTEALLINHHMVSMQSGKSCSERLTVDQK